MPRRPSINYAEVARLREQGFSWATIAGIVGASGESTVREGYRRYMGSGRIMGRTSAARTAAAARWGGVPEPRVVGARTFGVEIEFHTAIRGQVAAAVEAVVGYHIHLTGYHGTTCTTCGATVRGYRHWKLETDSSATRGMRNAGAYAHHQGGELVSPVLSGQAGLDEVKRVLEALRSVGARVDSKHGMHTHLGVGDLGNHARYDLLRMWAFYEDQLFGLVSRSRQNNMYCQRLARRSDLATRCDQLRRGGSVIASHTDALNLSKLPTIGTAEVRIHQGTLNGKKATMWVRLMVAFTDAVAAGVLRTQTDAPLEYHLRDLGYLTTAEANWFANRRVRLAGTRAAA